MMAEYKKQTEGQTSSSEQQQPPSSSSPASSMGMMRLPGRSRAKYGLDLGPGGVSDTTFEAAVLGELAVISIEPDVRVCEGSIFMSKLLD